MKVELTNAHQELCSVDGETQLISFPCPNVETVYLVVHKGEVVGSQMGSYAFAEVDFWSFADN